MSLDSVDAADGVSEPFHHEAFVYDDDDQYIGYLAPFIMEGLDRDQAVLVAVPAARLGLLRDGFGSASDDQVRFAAMEDVGQNPARIIPVWADFVEQAVVGGRRARGVGEPIWPGRTEDELVECVRHEALLNLAFADAWGFQLLCPYDATHLATDVIDEAHRTHPHVSRPAGVALSADYVESIPAMIEAPLSPIPPDARRVDFDANSLSAARHWAADVATGAGLTGSRVDDLMVAISEGMTNSVRHGGGVGELWVWSAPEEVLCEIRDGGRLSDPLVGRVAPQGHQLDGRGLWIVNQVCDLVQMRAMPGGQAMRLHFTL